MRIPLDQSQGLSWPRFCNCLIDTLLKLLLLSTEQGLLNRGQTVFLLRLDHLFNEKLWLDLYLFFSCLDALLESHSKST